MECNCQSKAQLDSKLLEKIDVAPILEIINKEGREQSHLITILQQVQEHYGYLPNEAMLYIAAETGIKASKIYGVATFYTQFRLNPVGKYLIMLCQGTACHVNGAGLIERTLVEHLGISEGETTEDGLFTLNNVACLGCCSLAPVMMINGETYAKLTPDSAIRVIESLKSIESQEVTS